MPLELNPQATATLIVEEDFFILKGIKFNHKGEYLEESQYLQLIKDVRKRRQFFRNISGKMYCSICLTVLVDIEKMDLVEVLKDHKSLSTKSNNHLNHLLTKRHNVANWKIVANDNNAHSRQTNILTSENKLMCDDIYEGPLVKQLRWALVNDLSNGIISAEGLAESNLVKVAFHNANAKVPCGSTIINNLCLCYDEILKNISTELQMAKLIVSMIDIWSGPNKISYIGLSLCYLVAKCKLVGDTMHNCQLQCVNTNEEATSLEIKNRIVAICPLVDSTTHDADSIKSTVYFILTNTYGISSERLFLLIGDNASVNLASANLMGIPFIGCMAHTMNLTIKDILTGDSFGELEALQIKVNAIISLFNKSPIAKSQAEISKAVKGYSKTRFNSYFNSLSCIWKLKNKINQFFENIYVPRRSRQRSQEAYEFEDPTAELPERFDLDSRDYNLIYILLKFKDSFDKAIRRYSFAKSRVGDIIPIYKCLQNEVDLTYNALMNSFGTDTEDGRNIGRKRDNEEFPLLIKQCIAKRYNKIAKDPLIVGAYLICGDRMWEHDEVPKTANMSRTCSYYAYLESIKIVGTGMDEELSLYEEVINYLVRMITTLQMYNIGIANVAINSVDARREIESWVNLSISQYIRTSLIALSGKFTKQVDWCRIAIDSPIVANLGIFKFI